MMWCRSNSKVVLAQSEVDVKIKFSTFFQSPRFLPLAVFIFRVTSTTILICFLTSGKSCQNKILANFSRLVNSAALTGPFFNSFYASIQDQNCLYCVILRDTNVSLSTRWWLLERTLINSMKTQKTIKNYEGDWFKTSMCNQWFLQHWFLVPKFTYEHPKELSSA